MRQRCDISVTQEKQVLCQVGSLHKSLLVDELVAKRSRPHHVHLHLYRQLSLGDYAKPTWRSMSGPGTSKSIPVGTIGGQWATLEDEWRIHELNARVRTFAAHLSPTLRRTFGHRDVDGLSISETACILGILSGRGKAQSARARAKLKESMSRSLETHTVK